MNRNATNNETRNRTPQRKGDLSMTRRLTMIVAILGLSTSLATANPLHWGADKTDGDWDTTTNNWTLTDGNNGETNWVNGSDATFKSGTNNVIYTITVDGTITANSINRPSQFFLDFVGGTINLGAGGITMSGQRHVRFSNTVALTASQEWGFGANNSGVEMQDGSTLNMGANNLTLTFSNNFNSNHQLAGTINGSGSITVNGTVIDNDTEVNFQDSLNLTNWLGDLTIDGGRLTYDNADNANSVLNNTVTIGTGTGTSLLLNSASNLDVFANSANLFIGSDGTLDLAGITDTVSSLTVNGIGQAAGVYEADDHSWLASGTLHVIPEPASLALVGLGGLVMIRRKH